MYKGCMSVMHFGVEAFGNIVKILVASDSFEPDKVRFEACTALATISKANTRAFNKEYGHSKGYRTYVNSGQIREASLAPNRAAKLEDAVTVATLLHYNCDEDDYNLETDENVRSLMTALTYVLNRMLLAQKEAFERSQKLVKAYSPGP